MRTRTLLYASALVIGVTGALEGCAAEKCGFGGCAGDAQVSMKVQSMLDEHPTIWLPGSIEVQTLDRVVYLHGTVDSRIQSEAAAMLAAQTSGVSKVVNTISVVRTQE
jgi:osmotically-inducible protein OsmY